MPFIEYARAWPAAKPSCHPSSYIGPTADMQRHVRQIDKALAVSARRIADTTFLGARIEIDLSSKGTRHVFNGRRIWGTESYPSRKAGQPIQSEGSIEPLLVREMEVDVGVYDFRAQAVCFTLTVGGTKRQYFADFLRLRADGYLEVIEVKADPSYLEEKHYRDKIEGVAAVCEEIGWRFRIVYGDVLRANSPLNRNVEVLQSFRCFHVSAEFIAHIENELEARAEGCSVGWLIAQCAGDIRGRATLGALVSRGLIHVDLTKRITAETMMVAPRIMPT